MYTEKSVQAAKDVKAQLMFPIHWGTFDLSNHAWYEPVNLVVKHAQQENVNLVTPKLGQTVEYGVEFQNELWWKDLEGMSVKRKAE